MTLHQQRLHATKHKRRRSKNSRNKFWKMELGYLSHTHLFFIPLLYSIYKQNNNRRGEKWFQGKNKTNWKYDALWWITAFLSPFTPWLIIKTVLNFYVSWLISRYVSVEINVCIRPFFKTYYSVKYFFSRYI